MRPAGEPEPTSPSTSESPAATAAGEMRPTASESPYVQGVHLQRTDENVREIAALARAAGYDIELLSPFNTMLFPLIAGVRLVNKMRGHDSADDALPSKPVNAALDRLFGAEAGLIGRLPFPFGVSLVAVLRRPAAAHRPG